jgi:hypothetical protein
VSRPTLQDHLTDLIVARLSDEQDDTGKAAPIRMRGATDSGLQRQASAIAEDLVNQAMASGLPLLQQSIENQPLGGGNTAEVVSCVTLHAPFVFKLDTKQKKLAEEAQAIRTIKSNLKLPADYRAAWPTVYAIRAEAPFAYLMELFPKEDGWSSFEDLLYPRDGRFPLTNEEAVHLARGALDVMFTGFKSSVDTRSRPSVVKDYVGRISERLDATAKEDPRFAARPLIVRGLRLRPWSDYLALLTSDQGQALLDRITPSFCTVIHGDPNPGNLMLRQRSSTVEVRFIDPKEWVSGDYLFDVTKLIHFIEATGPIEKPAEPGTVHVSFEEKGPDAVMSYQFRAPGWTSLITEECRRRVDAFATANNDLHWQARYELAMASNLLGLPHGRLIHKTNPRPESALMLYAEGMLWLDRFCARLGKDGTHSAVVTYGEPTDLEPKSLAVVRNLVLKEVPGAKHDTDRRGFQLLHWAPNRPNDRGKPQELSLEHEVRLKPATNDAMKALLDALHGNSGRRISEQLLPRSARFGDLVVHRLGRAPGSQSVDHYYEISHGVARTKLIPRMYSLRQRIRGSDFMTWSSQDPQGPAPMNLELPFVALGSSGMTARLEFNWMDVPEIAIEEALNTKLPAADRMNNPIYLASLMEGLSFAGAVPAIEHTTFREKFDFRNDRDEAVFALNVDFVTAQSLATRRIGSYVDVDISSYREVSAEELGRLSEFAAALAGTYALLPNLCTKVFRDAGVVDLLPI